MYALCMAGTLVGGGISIQDKDARHGWVEQTLGASAVGRWAGRTGARFCATWNGSVAIRARRSRSLVAQYGAQGTLRRRQRTAPVLCATTARPMFGYWPNSMNCTVPHAGRRLSGSVSACAEFMGTLAMRRCRIAWSRTSTTCARPTAISGYVASCRRRGQPDPQGKRSDTYAWIRFTRALWMASRGFITSMPSMQ